MQGSDASVHHNVGLTKARARQKEEQARIDEAVGISIMKTTPIKFPKFDITKDNGRVGRYRHGDCVFAHHRAIPHEILGPFAWAAKIEKFIPHQDRGGGADMIIVEWEDGRGPKLVNAKHEWERPSGLDVAPLILPGSTIGNVPCTVERLVDVSTFCPLPDTSLFETLLFHPCTML